MIELSAGLTVMTGNLSAGQADDHVDVVAGLDDRADAGDLVDLDRHAAQGGGAIDVGDLARGATADGRGAVIWAPVATGCRAIWPMTCDGSVNAPGRICGQIERLGRHLVGLIFVDRGMSTSATTTGPVGRRRPAAVVGRAWAPDEQQDADERHDREEDPDEQDESIRALQVGSPRGIGVTGGTTLAPAQRPRDYTKGLGPLGGNGRKSCTRKVCLQGRRTGASRVVPAAPAGRCARQRETAAGPGGPTAVGSSWWSGLRLDRVADLARAELVADLAAQEDQGDDGDDGDEREDQCVFGETLAFLVRSRNVHDREDQIEVMW